MRKITAGPVLVFMSLLTLIVALGLVTNYLMLGKLAFGDFRGIALTLSGVVFIYLYAFLIYRFFLLIAPLTEGELAEGSRQEFTAHVNSLFYLLIFNSLIRTHVLPAPLMRLIYIALGAHLGRNTYSVGAILDPPLTFVGNNTIIGHDAALFSHIIEGRKFALAAIRIGDNVTVGAHAIIMPGVIIEDGAIVSSGSVVSKDTHIGPTEIWGGVPARCLGQRSDSV